MPRDLDSALQTETESRSLCPVYLVELSFACGHLRLWTGQGVVQHESNDYNGVGTLGGITTVRENSLLAVDGVSFTLSGIPSEYLSLVLGERYQGRPAKAWVAAMDGSDFIGVPYLMFAGRMDVAVIKEAADTGSISMSAESKLIDLDRVRTRRYTDVDQQINYSGDKGFEYVAEIHNATIPWGTRGVEAPLL